MSKYDTNFSAKKQENLPYQPGIAVAFAKRGFRVFPLKPGAKTPARKGWQSEAASDPDTVRTLFAGKPDSNIGIAMGGGFFAFDCDRKDGKDGDAALRALLGVDAIWLDLTFTVATPSGGLHYVFRCPADKTIRNSVGKIAPGVDVRGDGGYLATVGSVIDGKRYVVPEGCEGREPIEAPECILALVTEAAASAEPRSAPVGVELDTPAAIERARAYLAEAEPAIEGQGGNDRAYATAAAIMDMGVSTEMASILMAEVFNPRCIPQFPEDELEAIVRHAAAYRQNEPGCDDPAAHFDIITGWTPPANDNAGSSAKAPSDARALLESGTLNLAALTGKPVPPREWLVEGWIPAGNVTLLYGDGGTGKSLAAMQLAVAVATGRPWFGLPATTGPALYLTAEDDETELHRRIADIAAERGLTLADLAAGLTAISLAAADPALAVAAGERDRIKFTPLWKALKAMIADVKPRLVVLDTLADIFAGNENIRAQARAFIGALRAIAIESHTAIVVLAHPSRAGLMTQGHNAAAGSSGSTAWHNSVRSRLLLERGDEKHPDLRVLKIVKANYGQTGAEIRLRWHDGAFVAEGGPDADAAEAAEAEHVFLELLDAYAAEGRPVGPNEGKNYAPSIFGKDARSRAFDSKMLAAAMNRLFAAGAIRVVEVGPPSKRRATIVRADTLAEAA